MIVIYRAGADCNFTTLAKRLWRAIIENSLWSVGSNGGIPWQPLA